MVLLLCCGEASFVLPHLRLRCAFLRLCLPCNLVQRSLSTHSRGGTPAADLPPLLPPETLLHLELLISTAPHRQPPTLTSTYDAAATAGTFVTASCRLHHPGSSTTSVFSASSSLTPNPTPRHRGIRPGGVVWSSLSGMSRAEEFLIYVYSSLVQILALTQILTTHFIQNIFKY
jgi:hypothetical protein